MECEVNFTVKTLKKSNPLWLSLSVFVYVRWRLKERAMLRACASSTHPILLSHLKPKIHDSTFVEREMLNEGIVVVSCWILVQVLLARMGDEEMLLSLCAASVVAVMYLSMLSPRGKGRANHGNLIVRQLVERNRLKIHSVEQPFECNMLNGKLQNSTTHDTLFNTCWCTVYHCLCASKATGRVF